MISEQSLYFLLFILVRNVDAAA